MREAVNIKLEARSSRVEEIAEQLRTLSGPELRESRTWLDEYENQVWDEQFGAEVAAGKWDALTERALKDHGDGNSAPSP
jgi:hypothetical protein